MKNYCLYLGSLAILFLDIFKSSGFSITTYFTAVIFRRWVICKKLSLMKQAMLVMHSYAQFIEKMRMSGT